MSDPTQDEDRIAGLLDAMRAGDPGALEALVPLVYEQLRLMARGQRLRWQGQLTLNATAIVNETYLRLVGQQRIAVESRDHFFALAARAMRHILINYARDRKRLKRGGGVAHSSFTDQAGIQAIGLSDDQAEELAALDEALDRLERIDTRQSRIVECRFFGGMSIRDTAAALDLSPATVKREWTKARAWLYREIRRNR